MILASNDLQPRGIWTQKDKYIQLVLLLFQIFCFILYLYHTYSFSDQNYMKILFLFYRGGVGGGFHPGTIIIKILCLDLFIDISGIKPISMTIKI